MIELPKFNRQKYGTQWEDKIVGGGIITKTKQNDRMVCQPVYNAVPFVCEDCKLKRENVQNSTCKNTKPNDETNAGTNENEQWEDRMVCSIQEFCVRRLSVIHTSCVNLSLTGTSNGEIWNRTNLTWSRTWLEDGQAHTLPLLATCFLCELTRGVWYL